MPFDIGDRLRVTGTFRDYDGDLVDPTTVTILVMDPDGNIDFSYAYPGDVEVVRDSLGVFHLDVAPDEDSEWWARVVGTGTANAASEEAFDVEIQRVRP